MHGHAEPIRIREGERILFRVLSASGNMGISPALPGHRSQVLALRWQGQVPRKAVVQLSAGKQPNLALIPSQTPHSNVYELRLEPSAAHTLV